MSAVNKPSWLSSAIFYQIYPQSYYDSNGDGIGDIPGIIAKLPYIQSLGVNAIWLNPCFVSPFLDAGYDVADYYTVAPRYGTNADLRRLFSEAHKRGIRICLDLVAGHTSIEHPWFKASCRHERNEYSDHFIWTNSVWDGGDGKIRLVNGYAERDGSYATNFFWSQPALNYGFATPNPDYAWQQPVDAPGPTAVRAEMEKVMRYWLDAGCDGFRVDMAPSLVKHDPEKKAVSAYWQEVRAWFDAEYPEAVLIAEWGMPLEAVTAGFHIDFLLPFGEDDAYRGLFYNEYGNWPNPGTPFFNNEGGGDIQRFLGSYLTMYQQTQGQGYISIPSANHDFPRPNCRRGMQELKSIFAFLLTMPGMPIIYYGDEIGMRFFPGLPSKEGGYGRTGTRTPMQWDATTNAGFSSAPATDLYLPIDPNADRPTVTAQEKDADSLLNTVRALISLRRNHPALGNDGTFTPLYAQSKEYPFVYERALGNERLIVALNPRKQPAAATFPVPGNLSPLIPSAAKLRKTGEEWTLSMPGLSYAIYCVEE